MRRAGNSVNVTIQGLDAMCTAPRQNAFGKPAGCQGNDNIDNEVCERAAVRWGPHSRMHTCAHQCWMRGRVGQGVQGARGH